MKMIMKVVLHATFLNAVLHAGKEFLVELKLLDILF